VYLPVTDVAVADSYDFAHALRLRAELRVAEETANVLRRFVVPDIEKDQSVPLMPQRGTIKAVIQGEKSWAF
jgi:hypothetical protein